MTHLEEELLQLKQAVLELMKLTESQLQKAKQCIMDYDRELASEVIHYEKRINAMELSIDRDCENIFALFNPVATDLRYVLAALKINSHLERIGDHAEGIARYVIDVQQPFDPDTFKDMRLSEMFDISISMMSSTISAFEFDDTSGVRKVFERDATLNMINRDAASVLEEYARKTPDNIRQALYLFSTVRKLERVGDLSKNIAEELIFYQEAKVLKHKKGKQREE